MEKSLLQKGLNFSTPPKKLNHADYLVNFELFYRDIRNLQFLPTEDLDFLKIKNKDVALSSFRTYNDNVSQHLSKEESDALKYLSQNKQIVIQISDKGNYNERMENFFVRSKQISESCSKRCQFLEFYYQSRKTH